MKKLFHRFSHKDEKILKRELALAHMCIALLSLGMIAVLLPIYEQLDSFNKTLVVVADVLLALVALSSVSIVVYIQKNRK